VSLYGFELVFGPLSEREEAIARLGLKHGRQGACLVLRELAQRKDTEQAAYDALIIRQAAGYLDRLWAEATD
jgi:hypothetical protein